MCAHAEVRTIEPEVELFSQGNIADAFFIIASGCLETVGRCITENVVKSWMLSSGEFAGLTEAIAGGTYSSSGFSRNSCKFIRVNWKRLTDATSEPASMEHMALEAERIARRKRNAQDALAHLFNRCSQGEIRNLESMSEWMFLKGGKAVDMDAGDGLYIVISGKLIIEYENNMDRRAGGREAASGDCIWPAAFITDKNKGFRVAATRDSFLLKYSANIAGDIIAKYPYMLPELLKSGTMHVGQTAFKRVGVMTRCTFTLIPLGDNNRASYFAKRLSQAMNTIGSARFVDSSTIISELFMPGKMNAGPEDLEDEQIDAWFEKNERENAFILFFAGKSGSKWTRKCASLADCVVFIVDETITPESFDIDAWLPPIMTTGNSAATAMVFLHEDSSVFPRNTKDWIGGGRIQTHLHIRNKEDGDYKRCARILTNNAICLVMSGGGARGYAHIGVIRALEQSGIAVDMVGGASIGAVIGSGLALGMNSYQIEEFIETHFVRRNPLGDYTLPIVSLIKGKNLDRVHRIGIEELCIEDLWINYFCITSNLSKHTEGVHDRGLAWKAIRASTSIPGFLPPVLINNEIHVDGGLVNNFPVDRMRERSGGLIIASDASHEKERVIRRMQYPSARSMLWRMINPLEKRRRAPHIIEIVMRSMAISATIKKESVKDYADLYINPPIGKFGILEMKRAKQIIDVGYAHGLQVIRRWLEDNRDESRKYF